MPFHIGNPLIQKQTSFEYRKAHELEYRKFLKDLQTKTKTYPTNKSKEKCLKKYNHHSYNNNNNINNYLFERRINLQNRQNQRKIIYERIQKENIKFTQKLIHAKTLLNRYEQKQFFDKHCKLSRQLQRYHNPIRPIIPLSNSQRFYEHNIKTNNTPAHVPELIHNIHDHNNHTRLPRKCTHTTDKIFMWNKSSSNMNNKASYGIKQKSESLNRF